MRRFKSSLKGMYFSFLFSSKDERFILVEHSTTATNYFLPAKSITSLFKVVYYPKENTAFIILSAIDNLLKKFI